MASAKYHHGDLRRALIDAGVTALEAKGEPTISLRAIARECGATAAAAYRHFPSKDALLRAVAASGFDDLVARFQACRQAQSADKRDNADLAAFGRVYIGFARDRPAMFRLMFGGGYQAPEPVGSDRRPGAQAFELLRQSAARAAGQPVDDPAVLKQVVRAWSLVHGYAMLYLDGRLPPGTDADEFLDAMFSQDHSAPTR